MKFIKILLGFIYGLVYGVAHVVPGLSGGTFLVIFGCYETVCEAFALNIKEIKKNFLFLLFLVIGTVAGLIGFVHVITFLFDNFEVQIKLFFMGLILGGIPLISKIATEKEKYKPACILPFILGLFLVIGLFLIEKYGISGVDATSAVDFMFYAKIVIAAFFAAIAMVMPGISGAFVLVAFGVYELFVEALKEMDFAFLLPVVIGLLLGIIIGARLVLLVIKRHTLLAYSAILGMVIGSVVALIPEGFGLNAATFTGIACLAAGVFVAYILGKRESTFL
jgi:putative membrane protein